jgi:hypothetical protein
LAGREERLVVLPRAVAVVRMQHLVPNGVAGQEPIRGDAEELLDVRAHRERHAAELRLVRVDRARHLPEQGLVGGLRLERPSFGLVQPLLEVGAIRPLHRSGIGRGEPRLTARDGIWPVVTSAIAGQSPSSAADASSDSGNVRAPWTPMSS